MICGEYQEALNEFKNNLEQLPSLRYKTYIKMGQCLLELEETQKAMELIKKGMELATERNADEWVEKAKILLSKIG